MYVIFCQFVQLLVVWENLQLPKMSLEGRDFSIEARRNSQKKNTFSQNNRLSEETEYMSIWRSSHNKLIEVTHICNVHLVTVNIRIGSFGLEYAAIIVLYLFSVSR